MERRTAEEVELRTAMSFNPANDDWRVARQNLLVSVKFLLYHPILTGHIQSLKQPVRYVKANKELKSAWGVLRRQIVPKIGQLTNDPQAISLIVRLYSYSKGMTTDLTNVCSPPKSLKLSNHHMTVASTSPLVTRSRNAFSSKPKQK